MKAISTIIMNENQINNQPVLAYFYFGDYQELHNHEYWEFILIRDGTYLHTLNKTNTIIKKHDACLLRPKIDKHKLKNQSEQTCHYVIRISNEVMEKFCNFLAPGFLSYLLKTPPISCTLRNSQAEKIMTYDFYLKNGTETEKKNVFNFMISFVLEIIFSKSHFLDTHKPEWFTSLLLQINAPQNMHWQVKDVVTASHFSHTNLLRYFHEYEHRSIANYLESIKMSYARELLQYSNINILEIATLLGYADSSHFNRAFKKNFNCTPSQFKRK